jgi:opacity protein-like surface antigen
MQSRPHYSLTTWMPDGSYKFDNTGWLLQPYAGAGAGVVDLGARPWEISQNAFLSAYQARGSVNFSVTQKLLGKFEYRWSSGYSPGFGIQGVPAELQLRGGGFRIGLKYHLQ